VPDIKDVKSASRVLDVFELLARDPQGLSLKQISQSLHIPPSSCHALLQTLQQRGYVLRDEATLVYRLGTRLFELAASHSENLDLVQVADPVMDQMSRLCDEAVSLAILQGTDVVFIHKKTAGDVIRIVNPVGTRLPAHATGLGKAILAALPAEELDVRYPQDELPRLTPHTITSKRELRDCLDRVRETGVAYDREESRLGVQAVGSVIRDRNWFPVAAVTIAVLAMRPRDEGYWHRLERLAKAGASVISARLGCPAPGGNGDLSVLTREWLADD